MEAFVKTDVGKLRDINEDYYYISNPEDEIQVFILADGMGGYNGGEVASRLATTTALSYIKSNFQNIPKEKEDILNLIKSAMEYANMVVYEKSNEDKELEGMGTTLEVSFIYNNRIYIGHAGDSRIYRIRRNFIRKLTRDHSYVQKLVKDGTITEEQARNHPKKNMLVKALGCTPFLEPDVTVKGFMKDDIILMCSDGLSNMLKDEEIFEIIKAQGTQSAEKLVENANENGGYDNITAVVIIR